MNKLMLVGIALVLLGLGMMTAALVASHRAEGQIRMLEHCEPSKLGWGHGRLGDGCHTVEREDRK